MLVRAFNPYLLGLTSMCYVSNIEDIEDLSYEDICCAFDAVHKYLEVTKLFR